MPDQVNGDGAMRLAAVPGCPARVPGSLRGRIWTVPDIDDADDEIARLMEAGPVFPDVDRSR